MSQIKSVAFDDGNAPIPNPDEQMKAAKAQGDVNILPTEVAVKPTSEDEGDDVQKKAADVTGKLASQVEGKPEVVLKHKVGDSQSDSPAEINTTPKNVVVL